jgi:tRNA modification GTPase
MRHLETDSVSTSTRLSADTDTICALATAHGLGAISIIRVSGPTCETAVRKLAGFLPEKLESHKIYYGILLSADGETPLDEVLISYFTTGRSFTGETTFEISCHGSETIVSDVLRELVAAGARPAKRGEFTYRAFMNGRLDLVQAESVLAMIESKSSRATQLALRQLQGGFSKTLRGLLEEMTWVLAQLEANIDYAAEDIEIASRDSLVTRVKKVLRETNEILATYRQGRIVREGYQVALVGRPNAGKSSLLNALAGEDLAIVTHIAGTTRDFVDAEILIDGFRVSLIDTAGLRATDDHVENIGIERTLAKLESVDEVFYIADATEELSAEEKEFFTQLPFDKVTVLLNKSDLLDDEALKAVLASRAQSLAGNELDVIAVSAKTGAGLEDVRAHLKKNLAVQVHEDHSTVANARHFEGLKILKQSLEDGLPLLVEGESPDLIALELQAGLFALYEILGQTYDDQVMDKVFQEFCLGK